jgi:hypothetical protein
VELEVLAALMTSAVFLAGIVLLGWIMGKPGDAAPHEEDWRDDGVDRWG